MGARQLGHFGAEEAYNGFKQSRWKMWPHTIAETRVTSGSKQMGQFSGHTASLLPGEAIALTAID
jgi:hypothetical protein